MRHFPRREVAARLAVSSLPNRVQPPGTMLRAIAGARPLHGLAPLNGRARRAEPLTAITPTAEP